MRESLNFAAKGASPHARFHLDWIWLAALLPAALLIGVVAMQSWIDPADLLRDPLAVAELKGAACCKVYYGLVSNLGVLLWMAGAAICLFCAGIIATRPGRFSGNGTFLLSAGLFSGFLGFDDLFLVHENVLPAFGVAEPVTYAGYGLAALGYLLSSWRQILCSRPAMLAAAIALLGTSVTVDWYFHSENVWRIIVEDGAKFAGICLWSAFHVSTAWTLMAAPDRRY